MSNFTILDAIILIFYLIIVLSLGLYYSGKKENSTKDYFLAGKNLGWFTIGISIFATNISSEHFIGLAGSGAVRGLAVGQFELMAIFVLILLGWFLAPIYLKSNVYTMPEFLEKRYNSKSIRKFFSAISITIYIFTKITLTLFAGGILFYKIFGFSIYTSAIIIVLITGLYSVIGGAASIVKTHIFQAIILITGALTLTIFGLNKVGGFSGLEMKLPSEFFDMFKPMSDPDYPWTGILFGAPILAFWYWCTDQYVVQRVLSAKSINDARRGSLFAAFLKILPIFILVVPGLIAVSLFPEIKGDEAYPMLLASDILPAGIKGLVAAGLLAAVMSSLSSVFNTTATLYTNDFYKPKHPNASERELVLIGRLSTTLTVVTAVLCVPLVKGISSQVYLFLQSIQGFISPPIAAIFLFGFFMKKATAVAAIWTLIIGEFLGLSRLIIEMLINSSIINNPLLIAYTKINFLHFATFLFIICSALMVGISLLVKAEKRKKIPALHYLISDSFQEIKLDLNNLNTVRGYKVNIYFSVFIVLIILGLWSLWY